MCQVASRAPVQFFIDERHQPFQGMLVSLAPSLEQSRDLRAGGGGITHERILRPFIRTGRCNWRRSAGQRASALRPLLSLAVNARKRRTESSSNYFANASYGTG